MEKGRGVAYTFVGPKSGNPFGIMKRCVFFFLGLVAALVLAVLMDQSKGAQLEDTVAQSAQLTVEGKTDLVNGYTQLEP